MPAKKMKATAKKTAKKKTGPQSPTFCPRNPRKRKSSRRRLDRLVRNPDLLISWSEGSSLSRSFAAERLSPSRRKRFFSGFVHRSPKSFGRGRLVAGLRSAVRAAEHPSTSAARSADSGTRRPAAHLSRQRMGNRTSPPLNITWRPGTFPT